MNKRISSRGIIFINNHLAVMHRVKENRDYHVFPGGGVEENESNETALKREIKEEFGIDINPKKLVYVYENADTIQYFYLCDVVGGSFGNGIGPEITNFIPRKGYYLPDLIVIENINHLDLEPLKLTKCLLNDIEKYGIELGSETTSIIDR